MEGPDGPEEHTRKIAYSPAAGRDERRGRVDRQWQREKRAVLELAAQPKRQRLEAAAEYEKETALALETERHNRGVQLWQL